jgi:cell division protein FtsB
MVTYRHKILFRNLRQKIKSEDIESLKLIGLFLAMLLVAGFFSFRILNTVSDGIETKERTENIQSQVGDLEKENKMLKSEREAALSESEVEAQYRALGYKKPGETIYIVSDQKNAPVSPTAAVMADSNAEQGASNWEKWLVVLFR